MFDSPFRIRLFFFQTAELFWKKLAGAIWSVQGPSLGGFWVGFWGFLGFQSRMPHKYPFNPKKGHQRHLEDQFLPRGVMTRLTFTLPGRGPRFFWMGGMIFWNLPPGFLGWCFVLTWRMGSLETADGEIGWFQMLTDPSGECYTMKKVTVDIRVVWFCSEVGGVGYIPYAQPKFLENHMNVNVLMFLMKIIIRCFSSVGGIKIPICSPVRTCPKLGLWVFLPLWLARFTYIVLHLTARQ